MSWTLASVWTACGRLLGSLRLSLGGRGVAQPSGKDLRAAGERAAARFLKQAGYTVLARNVQVPIGEADLVCRAPDGTNVLVEVKTRRQAGSGKGAVIVPEAAVGVRKQRKLVSITRYLTVRNGWHGRAMRIDVVAVDWGANGRVNIRHFVAAVMDG